MARIRSITGHLLLFALALALPILLLSGIIGWAYIRQEQSRIETLAERQAAQVVASIYNRLEAYWATLNVLAVSPDLLEGNLEEVRSRLDQMKIPQGVWFVVRDRSGRQILNTAVPRGERLPAFPGKGDPVVFQEGKPYTSNLIWAQMTSQWAVTLSEPLHAPAGEGEVTHALTIAIPVTHFQRLLINLPEGWIATINDRDSKILARSLNHADSVGKPMARQGWEITKDVPPGQGGIWRDIYTLEGLRVVGACHRMASTGWLIVITALSQVYQAPLRDILIAGAALAIGALVLAMLLAFLMGRRITGAVEALQVKAAAMSEMRVIDLPRTALEEVNRVAEVMRRTALTLRARQEQQTTQILELNHRVKNTLATIQSISRMTIRNSKNLETFDQAFTDRLMALSTTHNLLTETAWTGVELRELLESELRPFQAGRVSLDGPPVTLTSKVAVALGMAVHELGTNAAKYGALQGTGGSIQVRWTVSDNRLTLDWREQTGKKVMPPTRQGFGSRLIQQTIVRELGGTVEITFHEEGLRIVLAVPLSVSDHLDVR